MTEAEARQRFGDSAVDRSLAAWRTSPGRVSVPAGTPTWSAAKPTQRRWFDGEVVTFPSKMEARVYDRLEREVRAAPGSRLYRQVPLPLLSIDGNVRGVPYVLRVDFALVAPGRPVRYIEAKGPRRSREWARGAAAARAAGFQIEEVAE